jgi:glyoxylase-like metal-dependent hydrolase (beta-lactamase superfamily II)
MSFTIAPGAGFVEVGDRCWVARFDFLDVNVGLIGGERGLVVVDTLASTTQMRRALADLERLGAGPVVAAVNTHAHFDHFFGNHALTTAYDGAEVFAHDSAIAEMSSHAERIRAQSDREDPDERAVAETEVRLPDRSLSSIRVVDLGDRLVELIHPGRGHTAGDVVVRVGDADVTYAGDLVEESTVRKGVPGFGDDCYPLEWPATLDLLISMLTESSVVVPGHGNPVGNDFVHEQRGSIGVVAETIRDLAGKGIGPERMPSVAQWPYPAEELASAFARGYEHLPRGARTLPLV